jgi:hypothetical protein
LLIFSQERLSDWLLMIPFILMASVAAELTKIYLRYKAAKLATAPVVGQR